MNKKVRPQYQGAEIITALIFLCSMSAAMMYVLCRQEALVCTVIMTALSFGIYMLFYALRRKKPFAVLAFLALSLLAFVVMSNVFHEQNAIGFIDFIFKNSETFDLFFAGASIFLFSLIIGFTTCYFTAYLPRPSFLLLPALIPMILSARTAGGLPAGFVVFLAAGFGLVVLGLAQPEFPNETVYIDDKSSRRERLICMGIFGVISALVIAVVPRMTDTPMGEYINTVLRNKPAFYGRSMLTNFTNSSGVNQGANEPSEDVLFYASTYNPVNLTRWSFDIYNGENGWSPYTTDDYTTGWSGWKTFKQNLNTNALAQNLKHGAFDGKLEEYAPLLQNLTYYNSNISRPTAKMTIRVADDSTTKVIIHPSMTTDVSVSGYSGDIFRTLKDEMFTKGNMEMNASYTLEYYVPHANESLIKLFEEADMEQLLEDAVSEEVITESVKTSFLTERKRAAEYHSLTKDEPINPEIVELAEEITAGLSSDYEKALAIEKWFGEAEFVYDLNFVPEKTTAEYFLFKSKRGICTDFATAATLLLRAADIPAKYTEGFVLKEENRDEYGRYAVKAANAHAYATCYIEGYGWLEVDGTKYAVAAEDDESASTAARIVLITLGAAVVLAVIFRKQISEGIFAALLVFGRKPAKIRAIYLRTRKLVCKMRGLDPESTASGEVKNIAGRLLGLYNEAAQITDSADMLIYGGAAPDIPVKRLYKNYRLIRKTKRKLKK